MLSKKINVRYAILPVLLAAALFPAGAVFGSDTAAEAAGGKPTSFQKPFVIPIRDMITGASQLSLFRRLDEANAAGADLIVIELDTPGGELHSAMQMANRLFKESARADVYVVAFIPHGKQAYSAGTLIACACEEIVMGDDAVIGDCQPIVPTAEGYAEVGEKIQSPLRERFETYARQNGYPPLLAKAFVSKDIGVYEISEGGAVKLVSHAELELMSDEARKNAQVKIVVEKGNLLTLGTRKAIETGFVRRTADTHEELMRTLGASGKFQLLEPNRQEEFIALLLSISGLLFLGGVIAGYQEFKTPGFGFWGALAVFFFGLFFVAQAYHGAVSYLEVSLFALGIVMIALEIFVVPGFGFPGVAGALCLLVSIFFSFQQVNIPETDIEFMMFNRGLRDFFVYMGASMVVFILFLWSLPKSGALLGLVHKGAIDNPELEQAEIAPSRVRIKTGDVGIVDSRLRPSGRALFCGEPRDVISDAEFVEAGCAVRVVKIEGRRIYVVPVAEIKGESV